MNYPNTRALALLGNYLNERADFVKAREIAVLTDLGLSKAAAMAQLVAASCGLDVEKNAADRVLFQTYFLPAFKELDPSFYQQDAYYTCWEKAPVQEGNFCLKLLSYKPYECFVWNDLKRGPNGEALAQIGFFSQEFVYPAVLENNRIWMSVTPNEIETMRAPLRRAHGRVLTCGLGMGYFAFYASQKQEVQSVTVVERSAEAIALFSKYLLPRFPLTQKIRLVQADAFDFAAQETNLSLFDYLFVDLWRDVSDGLTLYKRFKALKSVQKKEWVDYWIEPTLQFYL